MLARGGSYVIALHAVAHAGTQNGCVLGQVRLASVRRSLFISDTERSRFLNHLVKGTREVLRTQQGLALHANYHEFCRLLGRLKTNYQLAELVRMPTTSLTSVTAATILQGNNCCTPSQIDSL